MNWLVRWLYVVALGLWLGLIGCVSFVIAPRLFGALPSADAGRIMGLIFPAYYAIGCGCGLVLLVGALVLWRNGGPSANLWLAGAGIAVIALAATLYAGVVVQPRVSALRPALHQPDAPADVRIEFDALHRRAVHLNVVTLVGTLALTALLAAQLGGGRERSRLAGGTSLQW